MFPLVSLPLPGEVLLITDELLASADFLLHHFLARHLKESKDSASMIVFLSEDIGRWKAIAGKSNVNLSGHMDNQRLSLIDAMSLISPALESSTMVPLRDLYDGIRDALQNHANHREQSMLVILDDLATLEWIGIAVEEVAQFSRALCALCRQRNAALVLRHHIVSPGEPDEVFKRLLQLCDYHLDVFPLSSGRSGSVSGQVALHCGHASAEATNRLISRNAAVQYRLTDTGSTFFDRGTGNGVL
ncbi:hypothetical protein BD309DRAFT_949243 [Dichomitus squalens]|uniref:Uncharacterized protein n=1 Tax=Dichomitus squalens TaxID=114155 RepID=A0A4Q9P7D3_9APHY|nr:hypothetical protein BD309DRAFT_949243 [Dichomitus squalens]TBU59710.1 hypothetical protein BD310DRAFT_924493 [Dichomitus squalens]